MTPPVAFLLSGDIMGQFTIRARLIATMTLLGLLIVGIGLMGIYSMKVGNRALEDVYTNQMASSVAIGKAKNSLSRARFTLDRTVFHPEASDVAKTLERADGFIGESDKFWQAYLQLPRNQEEDALAKDLDTKRQIYIESGLRALSKAVAARNAELTDTLTMKKLQELYGQFHTASEKLDDYQVTGAREEFERSNNQFSLMLKLSIAAIVFGALLIVASSRNLLHAILKPLDYALQLFDAMAKGDLSQHVDHGRQDEMGQLLKGLAAMQAQLVSTVRNVREGSGAIATASSEIAPAIWTCRAA